MEKKLLLLFLFFSKIMLADSVILMIGDGMGANHLKCASVDKPFIFLHFQ